MAWTYGFFNSVSGDRRYNAQQLSKIFEGLITDGVYESVGNKLAVQPNSGMTVQINTGRGWFGGHWVNNDSEYLFTLENSDVLLKRYAAVCIRVDETLENRKAEPFVKYSEFATDPARPAMERSETVREYCLAYILIPAGVAEITAADIEDARGNTEVCGWVTGLIEQVDTKTLWEQWQAHWVNFMTSKETEAANYMAEHSADFEAWQLQEQTDFLAWYNNLQVNLEGDVAATLTSKVANLEADAEDMKTDISELQSDMQNHVVRSSGVFDGLGWISHDDSSDYYTQDITVPGVTANNDLIIAPTLEYKESYINMGIEAIGQSENTVSFRCTNPDDINIIVDVIIYNF